MSFSCAKCGSENTQKLSAIYSSGTSYSSSLSSHSSVAGALRGPVSTSSSHQSLLADRVAPPRKREQGQGTYGFVPLVMYCIAPFVCFFMWAVTQSFLGDRYHGTSVCIGIVAGFAFVQFLIGLWNARIQRRNLRYNETIYAPAMKEWESKFYCHRCDTVFKTSV
jgi:hypothetical protein